MRLGVDLVGEEKSITHTCDAINCSRLAGLGVYLSPFLMWVDNLLTLFRCLFWMDVWLDDDLRGESGLVIVCVLVGVTLGPLFVSQGPNQGHTRPGLGLLMISLSSHFLHSLSPVWFYKSTAKCCTGRSLFVTPPCFLIKLL